MILFVIVGYISFLIIKPFIGAILGSFILSFMFYPLYERLLKKTKRKNLSALIIAVIVVVLTLLLASFITHSLSREARNMYVSAKERILLDEGFFEGKCLDKNSSICRISDDINDFFTNPATKVYADSALVKINNYIVSKVSNFVFSLPMIILNVFIAIFMSFYLLRDGKSIVEYVRCILPLKPEHQTKLIHKFKELTSGIVYGQILVALFQGSVGALGFWLFGISSPLLWGLLMAIFSLVPAVGTAIIWVPAVLIMALNGYVSGEPSLIGKSVGLLVYSLIVISGIDNFLRPKLVGNRAKVHPILVLLGVLGGIEVFGFIGLIVGPMVLALLLTLLSIYSGDKNKTCDKRA